MLQLPGLPPLTWADAPGPGEASIADGVLTMRAGPTTDWFSDPAGPARVATAPVLLAEVDGDAMLAATVTVEFGATFDAGVLFVHAAPDEWAKCCFERSPDGEHLAVSVVTRGVSDDCNGPAVAGNQLQMRVARTGGVFAFHHRVVGSERWKLSRLFALGDPGAPVRLGFSAQSPTGAGCTASFADVTFERATLVDPRDGS